jgi:hypothetical protein
MKCSNCKEANATVKLQRGNVIFVLCVPCALVIQNAEGRKSGAT